MEIPREISAKTTVWIFVALAILLFFLYRAYINSRQALQILETQVPNITRVAFETEVFAPTLGNLDGIFQRMTAFGASTEVEKLKKEMESHLWLGISIRNRGLKIATDIAVHVRLATPITSVYGFNGTTYARLEAKEAGVGKSDASFVWTYLEPRAVSVIFLGVRPDDLAAKPPYSRRDMQTWSKDFKAYFELVEVKSKEGAFDFVF
jgi:hypothetical protein